MRGTSHQCLYGATCMTSGPGNDPLHSRSCNPMKSSRNWQASYSMWSVYMLFVASCWERSSYCLLFCLQLGLFLFLRSTPQIQTPLPQTFPSISKMNISKARNILRLSLPSPATTLKKQKT